jgi:hypothetical protein
MKSLFEDLNREVSTSFQHSRRVQEDWNLFVSVRAHDWQWKVWRPHQTH